MAGIAADPAAAIVPADDVRLATATVRWPGAGGRTPGGYRAVLAGAMGKVPAIVHGDVVVTETAAIRAYLADASAQAGLAPPPGDAARAPYYRWMFLTVGALEAAITTGLSAWWCRRTSRWWPVTATWQRCWTCWSRQCPAMADRPEKPSRRRTSMSRRICGSPAVRLDRETAGVEAFVAKATAREGFVRAAAVDDAAMPQQPG